MFPCKYKSKGKALGEGTFGEVTLVEKNGKNFVLKKIKTNDTYKKDFFNDPIELDVMFRLNSPHLVKGVDIVVNNECTDNIGVVVEYIDSNLYNDLATDSLSDSQKKKIMYDVALGLKCLHDNNFLHLDIKPENMMYKSGEVPEGVLIDYGLSSYAPDGIYKGINSFQPRITFDYSSPRSTSENMKKTGYFDATDDIWALGISYIDFFHDFQEYLSINKIKDKENKKSAKLLIDFLLEKFDDKNVDNFLNDRVLKFTKTFTKQEKAQIKNLLKNMLNIEPSKRYTIDQVINHPFFKEFATGKSECFIHKPGKYDLNKVTQKHFLELQEIAKICRKEIPDARLDIFYMAVDIYLRFVAQASEEVLEVIEEWLPRLCMLIAYKYYNWGEDDELVDEIIEKSFLETIVYKVIEGRIREERYYSQFNTLEDAQYFYDSHIKNMREIKNYLKDLNVVHIGGKRKLEGAKISDLKL